jgi:small subunit ribosomal protein S3
MASERKFITENIRRVLLKEYLMKEVGRAGFGGVDVQRTPMGTRVTLITERPGIVIGRKGAAIKGLTRAIEEDFNFDNPQIEVQEVENANLNAQIMAEKLAFALERGWHFRRAGHSTVRRIMDNGARGCQIVISGKLTGQRHRTEKFKEGHIKFCGEPRLKFIKVGFAVAKLKPGVIGVKVEIMDPTAKLPDEVDVMTPEKAVEAMPEMADLLLPKKESAPQEPTSVGESAAGDESVENVKETVEGSGKEEGTTGEPSASAPTEEKPADEQSDVPATNSSKEV